MSHPVKGVDHCFILVNNLDKAAVQYGDLGFTLSPRGEHSKAKGSANYTIMFPDDYFELLGLLHATETNVARRQSLAELGEGLHAVACRIDTAEGAAQDLDALGIATQDLGSFARPVSLPDGTTGTAAFATVSFAPAEVPLGMVFMCQHKTRETVWLPELLDHANTACGLDAILAISEDPERDADRFSRLWADGKSTKGAGGYTVATGPNSAPLLMMTATEMAALYPGIDLAGTPKRNFSGLRIKVSDLAAARACLARAGIVGLDTERGVAVAPEYASGAIVEFVST